MIEFRQKDHLVAVVIDAIDFISELSAGQTEIFFSFGNTLIVDEAFEDVKHALSDGEDWKN